MEVKAMSKLYVKSKTDNTRMKTARGHNEAWAQVDYNFVGDNESSGYVETSVIHVEDRILFRFAVNNKTVSEVIIREDKSMRVIHSLQEQTISEELKP
jgi:hypothetical protein